MLRKFYRRIARQKQDDTNTKEGWDESYRSGYWDRLHALDEFAHNAVVAGYCNTIQQPNGLRILDVGCGEGLLLDFLKTNKVQQYHGIDISEIAIERAARRSSTTVKFEAKNIEDTHLAQTYSVVVINECAYYFKDLVATIKKLKSSLPDEGLVIVSMYRSRQTEGLWRIFNSELAMVDAVEITNAKKTGWKVVLFRKA